MAGAPDPGGDTELRAEGAIEGGYVAESAVERYADYAVGIGRQSRRRQAQACTEEILVRRDSGDALESAEKVPMAESGVASHAGEAQFGIGFALDAAQNLSYPCDRSGWGAS
jgi:hypothetical protein